MTVQRGKIQIQVQNLIREGDQEEAFARTTLYFTLSSSLCTLIRQAPIFKSSLNFFSLYFVEFLIGLGFIPCFLSGSFMFFDIEAVFSSGSFLFCDLEAVFAFCVFGL